MPIKYLISGLLFLSLIFPPFFIYAEGGNQNTSSWIFITWSGIIGSWTTDVLTEEIISTPQIQSFNLFQTLATPTTWLVWSWDLNGNALDSSGNANHG